MVVDAWYRASLSMSLVRLGCPSGETPSTAKVPSLSELPPSETMMSSPGSSARPVELGASVVQKPRLLPETSQLKPELIVHLAVQSPELQAASPPKQWALWAKIMYLCVNFCARLKFCVLIW